MQSASGLLAGIFAPFEQPGHTLKLAPGPGDGQFPAVLGGVVHDVARPTPPRARPARGG